MRFILLLLIGVSSVFSVNASDSPRDKTLTTKATDFSKVLSESESSVQQLIISGTVSDENGMAIPGVNIVIQGTTIGTITDNSGKFSINVPNEQSVLVFSFIGYSTLTVPVGTQRVLNISLEPETKELEEVVVVGYGIQKKESIVGAISQAAGEDIRKNIQGADLGTALSGAVPGMISLRTTGRPGGAHIGGVSANYSEILIRGKNTWNDANPLVLVDGVERDFRQINPYEIERISILKDASATAVFGVKGANGVILITTHRGQEGKAKLTFDATNTIKTPSRMDQKAGVVETITAYNYSLMHETVFRESSWERIWPWRWVEAYRDQTYPYYAPVVDWTDLILKDYTMDHNANLTISGGTKFVKYFGSLGYLKETDIMDIGIKVRDMIPVMILNE